MKTYTMIERPMEMIEAILLKHEQAVIEVMRELHESREAAVRAEREACALICENYGDEAFVDGRINADHHAYLIRQRGQA
jgi:hypothetical protein